MDSFSQFGQDLIVMDYYNNKKNGYFLEIGASDGILLSNCYTLEKNLNWTGICVEVIPYKFELLKKNRNSICVNKAIFNKSNEIVDFSIHKYGEHYEDGISGITNYLDKHKNKVLKNETRIKVETLSLVDLLDKNNAPQFIDYLSLDTEGSELEILSSNDFNKYNFGLISVEHNFIESRRTQIHKLLIEKNYSFLRSKHADDFFIYNVNK